MDIEVVRKTLEQASLASLAVGLAIGFFFSFNPVALAAIPVSLAYMTKAQARNGQCVLGSMFVLGMIVTHALLGLVVGLGGGWIQRVIGREWGLVLGPGGNRDGARVAGWIRLPIPRIPCARGARPARGAQPRSGPRSRWRSVQRARPRLVVLLGIAAGVGSPLFGVLLLLAFSVGRAVPVALGASAMGWIEAARA